MQHWVLGTGRAGGVCVCRFGPAHPEVEAGPTAKPRIEIHRSKGRSVREISTRSASERAKTKRTKKKVVWINYGPVDVDVGVWVVVVVVDTTLGMEMGMGMGMGMRYYQQHSLVKRRWRSFVPLERMLLLTN